LIPKKSFWEKPSLDFSLLHEATVDLMREIAWLMEWSGDIASAELADMQWKIYRRNGWAGRWQFGRLMEQ
jgi:hypothetical protein